MATRESYELYYKLRTASEIIKEYPNADCILNEIDDAISKLVSAKFSVAVVGEHKRGKSALLNALMGEEILVSDVLSSTCYVTQLVYSSEKRIDIIYKDRRVKVENFRVFSEYISESDGEHTRKKDSIEKIVVYTPSLPARENAVFYDTPGLNDEQTAVQNTDDVLKNADVVIMTISASMPLSKTEKEYICSLIERKNIDNIIFAVTFMDRVSSEDDEKKRLIETVVRRIKDDTYSQLKNKHSENDVLMAKAKNILLDPIVFPLSSKQALKAVEKNDAQLAEQSGVPTLKRFLAESFSLDRESIGTEKGRRIADEIPENFKKLASECIVGYEGELARKKNARDNLKEESFFTKDEADYVMSNFKQKLIAEGIDVESGVTKSLFPFDNPVRFYIRELSKIKKESGTVVAIINAIETATAIMKDACRVVTEKAEKIILDEIWSVDFSFARTSFPRLDIDVNEIWLTVNDIHGNIIPGINEVYMAKFKAYDESVNVYISEWFEHYVRETGNYRLAEERKKHDAEIALCTERIYSVKERIENDERKIRLLFNNAE